MREVTAGRATTSVAKAQARGRAELTAALVIVTLGGPTAFFFASAVMDSEVRREEAPLRAILGSEVFDGLQRGDALPQNFLASTQLGNERRVPDFELRDEAGQVFRMSEHRGRVVVMNFWTVTCGPCVEEMPSLVTLSRALAGRDDIELVTISTDRSWDTVHTVVPRSAPLRVLLDSDRHVTRDLFGTRLFPETWVIDRDGVVRLRIDGAREWGSAVALDAIESFL